MSVDFDIFWLIVSFSIPTAVELLVVIGVDSLWVHPISYNVFHSSLAYLMLSKISPSSASTTDDITLRMIIDRLRTASLLGGFSLSLYKKRWTPARLRASFLDR